MRALDILASFLLVVGGLNWGLISVFEVDLTSLISGLEFGRLGEQNRIAYGVIGLAALYQVVTLPGLWRRWGIDGEPAVRMR